MRGKAKRDGRPSVTQFSYQVPTSSVTSHHWYPMVWSCGLRHIGNCSAANLVLQYLSAADIINARTTATDR